VDAVVRVTEEPIDHDEVMVGSVVTCRDVVLVESLLCKHRKQQAHPCAHGDGKDCIKHVVLSHDSEDGADEVVLVDGDDVLVVIRHRSQ
jgi:hypothetical protein